MQIATTLVTPPSRLRTAAFIAIGVCLAALLAALALVLAGIAADAARPFSPRVADGLIPEGASVPATEEHLPALARLDADLRQALRDAAEAAAAEGVTLDVTSGWRSAAFQQWLLDNAVETYGNAEVARQFVATPDESRHVTGQSVDIGSLDAQVWLRTHGTTWGLCQVYANEPWHFERAASPGGACPEMLADASATRG
ncbi:M15 family metallopeptidase [Microbacterium sp. RD1]|uniref:M15 family metallopeptidase n=1 Tax=Microbacterium sp. RD1 TaxID=3457313 RepID=UPI003FA5BC01